MHRIRHLIHPALPVTSGARATALALLAASLLGAAGVVLQDKEPAPKPRGESNTHLKLRDDDRQLDIQMKGDVKLSSDTPDPVIVAGDGSFCLEEKKGGKTRTFVATKGKQSYTVDGKEQPLDAAGKEWLRAAVKETTKARAGREKARRVEVRVEGGQDKVLTEDRRGSERVIEIHARHMRDLDEHAHELERHAKELESGMATLSPEERARVQADLEKARAEMHKAREEGRKVRVEVIREHGEGPGTVFIRKGDGGDKKVVKRFKIRKDGVPGEAEEWSFEGPEGGTVDFEGLDEAIHIPPIHIPNMHIRTFAHAESDNPREEMAELQAELKALQARLDQLQKQLATTPKPPRPPKAPLTPKSTHPAPPPPPPPPPPAPDAPPAPPAPPAEPGH
jgi:hypothetical protein